MYWSGCCPKAGIASPLQQALSFPQNALVTVTFSPQHCYTELKITIPMMLSQLSQSLFDILTAGGNYCGTNIPVWMKGQSETPDQYLSAS